MIHMEHEGLWPAHTRGTFAAITIINMMISRNSGRNMRSARGVRRKGQDKL